MAEPAGKDPNELFAEYVNSSRVLIVDSSSASRVRLAATLSELGVQSNKITLAGTFEDGEAQMTKLKPRLVLCDFVLGNRSGLDLLQMQRDQITAPEESVFVLVTGNSSQTAVARAAEEDVDTFVLKPYTLQTLKASLISSVMTKIYPTEYMKTVKAGKELLIGGKPEEAIKEFDRAIPLDKTPTLAHFYKGQAKSMMKALAEAEGAYSEGLGLNKIHYKCLVGLFDILIAEKRNAEAYDVVKRIAHYFPANPKRLSSVLRLAILTEHFEDMEGYYRTFTQMDQRTDELVRYMCSALVVCGKFYLQRKHRNRAVDVFEKAAVSCAGQVQFLKYIIETLIDFEMTDAAPSFLQRYRQYDPTSETFKAMDYLVTAKKDGVSASLTKGRELLKAGVKHPLVYRQLIKTCVEAGLDDSSENLAHFAAKTWPERANEFFSIAGLDVTNASTA
jgi:CheY-like chemotaxis protein